jgi:hypothetical protein
MEEKKPVKIRMKTRLSGSRNGVRWPVAGETKELPESEALDLIAAGLAEPVAEQPKPEKATARKAEKRG